MALKSGMEHGAGESYYKLADLLATGVPQGDSQASANA
jgi:hypothetical protein